MTMGKQLLARTETRKSAVVVPTRPIEDVDCEVYSALQSECGRLRQLIGPYAATGASEVRAQLDKIAHLQVQYRGLAERIDVACAPATSGEIAERVAVLCGCVPIAGGLDASSYTRMLIYEIAASQPSRGALSAACRALIQTRRFVPPICDVLAELAEAEKTIARRLLESIDELKAAALEYIADEPERARARAEQRISDKADIRRRIESGKSIGFFNSDPLVAEVLAEMAAEE